jgi:hypothetical protein
MKKKLIVGVVITISVFVYLSLVVYGEIDLSKALRSKFMMNVVVPISTSSIAFGGIAYSIIITSSQQKENKEHERNLLASEFIGKSRSKWLSEFREAYSLFDSAVTDFCVEAMRHNPDIKSINRISEETFNNLKSKALFINDKAKYVQSFLNPVIKEFPMENGAYVAGLVGLDSKLREELEEVVNTSLKEVTMMADLRPKIFDANKIYDLESKCTQTFSAISKNTWESIKSDVKYSPADERKEIVYSTLSESFVELHLKGKK